MGSDKFSAILDYDEYEIRPLVATWPKNKGKPYSDDDLRLILNLAPTRANVDLLARALGRTPAGIALVYRWAMTSGKIVKTKRLDDVFVLQVKRVAKEIGWGNYPR